MALLAGCSASARHGPAAGPLGYPDGANQSGLCQPDLHGQPETVATDDIRNNGHHTVVIDRLVLVRPRHLALVGSYIVPGQFAVGQWASFPPPARQLDMGVQWASRHVTTGALVLPGHWINPVIGLKPPGNT